MSNPTQPVDSEIQERIGRILIDHDKAVRVDIANHIEGDGSRSPEITRIITERALMSLFTEEMARIWDDGCEAGMGYISNQTTDTRNNGANDPPVNPYAASLKEEDTEKNFGIPKEDKTEYEHLNRSVGQQDHQMDRMHDEQRQHSVLASLEQDKENK